MMSFQMDRTGADDTDRNEYFWLQRSERVR